MDKQNKKLTSQEQFKCLVQFMEKNLEIGRGAAAAVDKEAFLQKWTDLTTQLNSLGSTKRDTKGWQKVWSDLKLKVKRKMAENKSQRCATGGGQAKLTPLTFLEEIVAGVLNYNHIAQARGPVFGLGEAFSAPETAEVIDDDTAEIIETPGNTAARNTSSVKARKVNRETLLQDQTNLLTKIAENVQECSRYLRKLYKLEAEKLSFYKLQAKKQQEYRGQKIKNRSDVLECKKQELLIEKRKLMFEMGETEEP